MLELQEMIAAAQRAKLHAPVAAANYLEPVIAERSRCQRLGKRAVMMPISRDGSAQLFQKILGDARVAEGVGLRFKPDHRDPAADIASHGGWINQMVGCDDGSHADFPSQMHIRHHRDVLDIVSPREALDCQPDISCQRLGQPHFYVCAPGFFHDCASLPNRR